VTSATVLVVVAVAALVVLAAAAALLLRGRARRARPAASSSAEGESGFVCPFCRRAYDPAQTGRRCPGCGAAAPR
jgi:hypothetical protein